MNVVIEVQLGGTKATQTLDPAGSERISSVWRSGRPTSRRVSSRTTPTVVVTFHMEADLVHHPPGLTGACYHGRLHCAILSRAYPLPVGLQPIADDVLLQPKWALEIIEGAEGARQVSLQERFIQGNVPSTELLPDPEALTVILEQNDRVTPDSHWQDVRHLTLTASSTPDYRPGDVLTIYPRNFPGEVQELIALMGWDGFADKPLHFVPTTLSVDLRVYPPPPIQLPRSKAGLTLRRLLMYHLDINSIPRRSFFAVASHFTKDPFQQDRLREFTNPELVDELYDYTTRPRRSILEVLQEFESVKLPWSWIGSIVPSLRGRQFSIASGGPRKHPNPEREDAGSRFELLVAIVKYRTVIKKIRQGTCTRYLAALPVGTRLNVSLRRGGLHTSEDEIRRPMVLIAPGTGIAPVRALLWEGVTSDDQTMGKRVLFFGGRNRNADFFYRDEWDHLKTRMDLQVFTAFSRDQVSRASLGWKSRHRSHLTEDWPFRSIKSTFKMKCAVDVRWSMRSCSSRMGWCTSAGTCPYLSPSVLNHRKPRD